MRKSLVICFVVVFIGKLLLLSGCQSCNEQKLQDSSCVCGIYSGDVVISISESILKVMPDSLKGKISPDKIPASIQISRDEHKKMTMEILDFEMPLKGMILTPSSCLVDLKGETAGISGRGDVLAGKDHALKLQFKYEGKVQKGKIHVDGGIYVMKILGAKVVFEGKKIK